MEQFGVLTLGSRLKRLSDRLFQDVQDLYFACDIPISASHFPILRLLQAKETLSVVDVANELGLSHPAISKQVAKMIKDGVIDKRPDPRDSRRYMLMLSEKGCLAMMKVAPILEEMSFVLEMAISHTQGNFLTSLKQFEQQFMAGELSSKILDRLHAVKIIPYEDNYLNEFRRINLIWLERFFPNEITEHDFLLLNNPREHILNQGGKIWVAVSERPDTKTILGAVAVLNTASATRVEMAKVSVVDHAQCKGVAQRLVDTAVQHAKEQGYECISLETSSVLKDAKRLYIRNDFIEKPFPIPSIYKRADVYMEKNIKSFT